MLCLAFECQERGVLSTNGAPWTEQEIAEAVGGDTSLNLQCIEELLHKGVASRRQDGAIYSRRMVDSELARQAKSEKCSDAGRRGGRPPKGSKKGEQKGQKRVLPMVDSERGLEEEGETGSDSFDLFWTVYPKKKAKADALKIWKRLAPSKDLQAAILAALEKQMKWPQWTKDGGRFIPHPATWLNGKRWEDQEPAITVGSQSFSGLKQFVESSPFCNGRIHEQS